MDRTQVFYLALRYVILLLLGLGGLFILYLVFTPLTIYPVLFLLKLVDPAARLVGNIISTQGNLIGIIPACIAGAAYYFLLILNLTTPMSPNIRKKSILFLLISFLVLNILRIFIFILLGVNNYIYFDITHKLVWHFGSTILVIALWFVNVSLYKIKSIPVYSDVTSIISDLKGKKGKK